ncbi:hypothetical protein Tco_0415043 [Tanacetum coccineum]
MSTWITSGSKSKCETREPLPPLPKLIGAEPVSTSNSLISLADLTLNMDELTLNTLVPKMTKPTYDKVSPLHTIKKKTETKSPAVSVPQLKKKADLSAEQLLLTLMDEVKSLKEQIKVPSNNSPSVSQTGSLETSKGKQTTWFGICKNCGFKNDLDKDCYLKPKCSTCGSTDHLTKEHLEQFAINKTLIKLKAQSSMNPSAKKAPMKSKPFKECKYCGFNDHHFDNYEYYPGCEAAFVNGLKHNLISINQLCDANYKVLFTKTKGTIFNQNDEVVLISPRRKDVYVIDIRQEMKETYHVTFNEDDEAISQSSTEGDAINFNKNKSFPDDEFLEPRNSVSPEEPHVFTSADDHPALNDHVYTESADNLEPAKIQCNVIIKSIGNVQSSPTIILPSTAVDINPIAQGTLQPPIPQGRWSREKQIELVNIIGEPPAEVGLETQKLLQLMNVYMLTFSLKWNPKND